MPSNKKNTRSNAADKLPKGKKKMPEGIPFKKGYDPRRNMNGRPKVFDEFRKLALDIGEQIATTQDGTPLTWNEQEVTFAEFVLLSWVTDKRFQDRFADTAYGKVPDEMNVNTFDVKRFIQDNIEVFTDGQLTRLRSGESGESILAEVIREVMQAKAKKKR